MYRTWIEVNELSTSIELLASFHCALFKCVCDTMYWQIFFFMLLLLLRLWYRILHCSMFNHLVRHRMNGVHVYASVCTNLIVRWDRHLYWTYKRILCAIRNGLWLEIKNGNMRTKQWMRTPIVICNRSFWIFRFHSVSIMMIFNQLSLIILIYV